MSSKSRKRRKRSRELVTISVSHKLREQMHTVLSQCEKTGRVKPNWSKVAQEAIEKECTAYLYIFDGERIRKETKDAEQRSQGDSGVGDREHGNTKGQGAG